MKRFVLVGLAAAAVALLAIAWLRMSGGRDKPAGESIALPCLLNFRMDGCVHCERTLPSVEAVKVKHAGRLRVACLDIDRHPELKERFQVSSVPTLIFFNAAGREVLRHQGAVTPEALEGLLESSHLLAGGIRPAGKDCSLESLVALLEAAPEQRPGPVPANVGAASDIVVYYFHGDVRSGCSQEIENTTREVIAGESKPLLKGKTLAWHTLNIEAAENARWVKTFNLALNEYDLTRGIAVVTKVDGGKPVRWKVIGDLASYRTDLDKLRDYVRGETGEFLKAEAK
jgi:thioredoxin 1